MKKIRQEFWRKIISLALAVSMTATFSLGSIMAQDVSVVEENFISQETVEIQDTISEETTMQEETATSVQATAQEETTTGQQTTAPEETTILEETIRWEDINSDDFNAQQNKVLSLIKELPASDHEDFMDSVQVLYFEYEKLSETDQSGLPESVNKKYKEALSQAGDINHCDSNTKIVVMSDSLPWYIKVIVEKKSTESLQNALDNYYEKLYADDDDSEEDNYEYADDSDDEEDDYEYEDDSDDEEDDYEYDDDSDEDDDDYEYEDDGNEEDEYYYDDNTGENDNVEDEYYYDFPGVIDEHFSQYTLLGYDRDQNNSSNVATAYEISLYDTLKEQEYKLSENEKVMIILPYERTYLGYWLDVIHLTDDNSIEFVNTLLYSKKAFEKVKYDYNETMYDEDGEEEESNKIDVDNYGVAFEANHFSEYGVVLSYPVSKTCASGDGRDDNIVKKSPKTGYSLSVLYIIDTMAIFVIGYAIIYRRRRLKGENEWENI